MAIPEELFRFLLLSVYWFSPLIWLAYILLGRDMEYACDEAVVGSKDALRRKAYSLSLLNCADSRHSVIFCPPAFGEADVKGRIKKVLKFKRPAIIISAVAIVLLVSAALCLLTNPRSGSATAADNQAPGVYLRLGMPEVYSLSIQYEGGSGGCANADESAFDPEEYIWLDQLDGLTGNQSFSVRLLDENGGLIDQRSWTLDVDGNTRFELEFSQGVPVVAEPMQELDGDEAEQIRLTAQRELGKLYELGVLSTELKIDGDMLYVYYQGEEQLMGDSYFGRICPPCYIVNANNSAGYTINLSIDEATEKIFQMSLAAYAGEGDQPMADREPFVWEEGGEEYYYYDLFAALLPEDITIDRLCELLNEYWGFDGYTLSGTKYEMYGYDTEAPTGSEPVKSLCDNPFLTVYFDGDQPGAPMYVDIMNMPGNTTVMIGIGHAVG